MESCRVGREGMRLILRYLTIQGRSWSYLCTNCKVSVKYLGPSFVLNNVLPDASLDIALRHGGWPNRIQVSVGEVKSNFISRPTSTPEFLKENIFFA